MVTMRTGTYYQFSMKDYDFDLKYLAVAKITSASSTKLTAVNSWEFTLTGKGFQYDDGDLVDGTVNSITKSRNGSMTVSGLKISVEEALDVLYSQSKTKMSTFVKKQFAGNDIIVGNEWDELFYGYAGKDTIKGAGGQDKIYAGAGDDLIYGGLGADTFFGEEGKDTFFYLSARESTMTAFDTISKFSGVAGDRINLEKVDANTKTAGNQAFAFIGGDSFSGVAGELRSETVGSKTFVYGDLNGDKITDLKIALTTSAPLENDYFIL